MDITNQLQKIGLFIDDNTLEAILKQVPLSLRMASGSGRDVRMMSCEHPRILSLDNTIVDQYYLNMIISFSCKHTEQLFSGKFSPKLPNDIQRIAQRKLKQLHAAATLDFLRVPPGNRLEQLSGSRAGQWSIRINDQWRLCFIWHDGNASQVEIVDYH